MVPLLGILFNNALMMQSKWFSINFLITSVTMNFDNVLLLSHFDEQRLLLRTKTTFIKFLFYLLHNLIDYPTLLVKITFLVKHFQTRPHQVFYLGTLHSNILLQLPIYSMCCMFSENCDIYCDPLSSLLNKLRTYSAILVS